MSFSSNMSKTADKLITKYGEDVELIHRYDCVYDPTTGKEVCSENIYPYKGKVGNYTIAEQSAESINVDDLKVIIQTAVFFNKDWKLEYDSKTYNIIGIRKTIAQDMIITQEFQVRVASTL